MSALASASETLAQGLAYDAAGALTAQTLGNGVTQTSTYDADGQRSAQAHSGGAENATGGDDIPTLGEWGVILLGGVLLLVLARRSRTPGLMGWLLIVLPGTVLLLSPDARASDASYTYDSNGNVLTRSLLDSGATTYTYDALDRLTREQGPALTQSIGYDANGNRLSDGAGSYVYAPSSNRQTGRPQGPVTLDAAGHTTAQAGFAYAWDGAGRLKTVRLSGTLLATYHYDARHRRTRKETTAQAPQGAATVLYAYDANDHLIAETDAGGPIRSYVWRDDVPLAQIEHRPTRRVLYLETDHLNTPRGARNEAGTLVWRWESDAFGASLPDEDPDGDGQATTVNLRLPGQVFDPESGLHYNQARYYDPTSGRYLSPDPIGLAGGINTYAYVGNNPLSWVDPSGLDVTITINRTGSTQSSVSGTINVTSTVTNAKFSGHTLENRNPPNPNLPVPPGTYPASMRTDHTPNRIELNGVPNASNIQIHNANYPSQLEGCFGVGTSASTDFVGNSVNAMNRINNIISADGTGNITVIVNGSVP